MLRRLSIPSGLSERDRPDSGSLEASTDRAVFPVDVSSCSVNRTEASNLGAQPPDRWEMEVELRRGTKVRHAWVDDVEGLRVGAQLRLDGETEWWQVTRRFGRRRVPEVGGIAVPSVAPSKTSPARPPS